MRVYESEVLEHARTVWSEEAETWREQSIIIGTVIDRISDDYASDMWYDAQYELARIERRGARNDLDHYGHYGNFPRIGLSVLSNSWRGQCVKPDRVGRRQDKKRTKRVAELINDRLLPLSGITVETPANVETKPGADTASDACSSAETYFLETFEQLEGKIESHKKLSVYHDKDGEPVVLRKARDVSTGLALVPLNLQGSIVPAGTIIGIDHNMSDVNQTGYVDASPNSEWYTFVINGELAIRPIRVSPWTYQNPLDQSLFACSGSGVQPSYNLRRVKELTSVTLADFTQAAHKIIVACAA